MNDTEKLKLILEFLILNDGIKRNNELGALESQIYDKLEVMKEGNITTQKLEELHQYLESSILEYKEIIQKKYFEYGIVAKEYLIKGNLDYLKLDVTIWYQEGTMNRCNECELNSILPKRTELLKAKDNLDSKVDLLRDRYPVIKSDLKGLEKAIDDCLREYKEYYLELGRLQKGECENDRTKN